MKSLNSGGKTLEYPSGRVLWVIPFILCSLFLFFAIRIALVSSGACDELAAHIPSGYLYWTSGEFGGGVDNFPLGQLFIALPVKLLGYSYELFTEQHLFLFRLPVILMGLLLAIVVYRFAGEMFGQKAGWAALFLYALSPNVLAHTSLATLDLPIAFFICLTLYLLWRYVQQPRVLRLIAFSLALACALAIKVQAILLIPITLVALVAYTKDIVPRSARDRVWFFGSWLVILLIPWVLVNLAYLNNPLASSQWLPPQFLRALEIKMLHSKGGHFGYLMGEYSTEGWWYYFPVAILLKTPLPTLVLLALGLWRRPSRETLLFLFLPIAVFLGAAMRSKVNIGIRHVLIIYPFIFILAGRGGASLWSTWRRTILLAVLAIIYVAEAVVVAPHQLSYFNLLVGGTTHGHKFLIDSNYDWGLNDRFLHRYIQERDISYKINPHAFTPTTGHILVSANALYGVINGGPAAYAWLKETFPTVNRITYTWFEYDVPEDQFPPGERELPDENLMQDYLRSLRLSYGDVKEPHFRHALAGAMTMVADYGNAFQLLRENLRENPSFSPSSFFGGKLIVQWKLGVLRFRDDEYLSGFKSQPPRNQVYPLSDAKLLPLAERLRMRPQLAEVHHYLGVALYRRGAGRDAVSAFRRALLLDPGHYAVAQYLAWILATSADGLLRDGEEAVRVAEQLCADTSGDQASVLDTLAAAYAEAGRFTDAIRTENRAIELSVRSGKLERAEEARTRLALYEQNLPYRQTDSRRESDSRERQVYQ